MLPSLVTLPTIKSMLSDIDVPITTHPIKRKQKVIKINFEPVKQILFSPYPTKNQVFLESPR